MTGWLQRAGELARDGEPFMLVTVFGVEGSAPREVGAKMIVSDEHQWGTIGGGNLEFSAIIRAREILASGSHEVQMEDYPLGPAFGQCCGGRVRLGYERMGANDLDWLQRTIELKKAGRAVVIERNLSESFNTDQPARTIQDNAPPEENLAFAFLGTTGHALVQSMPPINDCTVIRETIVDARARIYVFGAGHVGSAIAKILKTMPVGATWIDRRADQFPADSGANIKIESSNHETEFAKAAPTGACFLVLTHDHQLDYDLVYEILKRNDSAYCGLIGSQTKRARFKRRLKRAGLDESVLHNLICPIGASGLTSKSPEIIALATVHEMLLAHQVHAMENIAWN